MTVDDLYENRHGGTTNPGIPSAAHMGFHETVHHPCHYEGDGSIECIDAISSALGKEGFQAMCRGNAIKYLWRCGSKGNPIEDLRKAMKYCEFAIEDAEE